jgi:hypothetical protein
MRGVNRGLFSKLNSSCKKKKIHDELSGTLPLEGEKTLLAAEIKKLNSGVRVRGVIKSTESVKFKLANIYKIKSQ